MTQVIDFQDRAVASLRARVAEVEEANRDLKAFAHGHSGAVSAIHAAVLAAMDAHGFDALLRVVTEDWPEMLGLDTVALALAAGSTGMRADQDGVQRVAPQLIARAAAGIDGLALRNAPRGHPLFGPAAADIRAEALIRLDASTALPTGLLLLGQGRPQSFDSRHGGELLVFLGRSLSRMIGRWLLP